LHYDALFDRDNFSRQARQYKKAYSVCTRHVDYDGVFLFFQTNSKRNKCAGFKNYRYIYIYIYTSYIQNVSGIDNNMTWTLNVKILSNPLHRNGHTGTFNTPRTKRFHTKYNNVITYDRQALIVLELLS